MEGIIYDCTSKYSPRRAKLLKDTGIEFVIEPSNIDESVADKLKPVDMVLELSKLKAEHVASKYPMDTIIGADTIVVHEDVVLGKPKDEADAYRMLKKLSGDVHMVYTGVTIIKGVFVKSFVSEAKVYMKQISDLEIKDYIATKEPLDKAGAYAIQGVGGKFIDHYQGDFFTIVGLPLKELKEALKEI